MLAALACRELLRFQPKTNLVVPISGEVEEWFFEPSDSSPIVVLLLCAWLLWRRRARLAPLWGRSGPLAWTALLWAVATAGFVWAVRTGAPDLQALALVPALLGAANLLGGPAAMRVAAPPAAVLLFALPLPAPLLNAVVWPMQVWTADLTGWMLGGLGLSALVSGDRIVMSDGLFAIIETCSGLRSVETLGLLSVLMIDLFGRRGLHAGLLLVASVPVAFAINGLRCVGLVLNPHSDVASIHNLQGIAMLLAGVIGLYLLDGALARVVPDPGPISAIERRARAARSERAPLAGRVAALAAFSALWLALSWLPSFDGPRPQAGDPQQELAEQLGRPGEHVVSDWLFLGKAMFGPTAHRRFASADESVDVFLAAAHTGERLRSYLSPKVAFPGSGWIVERESEATLAGHRVTLRELRKGGERLMVAHWFEGSPGLARETLRALFALDSSPWTRARIPVAVRLSTPLPGGSEARARARGRLERLAEQLDPTLQAVATPRGV